MGFERSPPRCENCRHRAAQVRTDDGRTYGLNRCDLGDFWVEIHSICDRWHGKNGDTIA